MIASGYKTNDLLQFVTHKISHKHGVTQNGQKILSLTSSSIFSDTLMYQYLNSSWWEKIWFSVAIAEDSSYSPKRKYWAVMN